MKDGWIGDYCNDVSQSILADPIAAIKDDTKQLTINGMNYVIGQIELWNARELISDNMPNIAINGLSVEPYYNANWCF